MRCSKCGRPAVIYIRYSGQYLCKRHFLEFVERRFKAELRRQIDLRKVSRIGVGVSGGKDSMTLLHLMNEVLSSRKDVEVVAILVDEGIKGYRDEAMKVALPYFKSLGIKYRVISFEEVIGVPLDEISGKDPELMPCSYCGVFRRYCLNLAAKEEEVDALALAHNLDDVAQSFLMNVMSGDVNRVVRMGPHERVQPGLIPRIYPVMRIPERELYLYALLRGIPFYHGECPYARLADRDFFRKIVYEREDMRPGTRHAILNFYLKVKEALAEKYSTGKVKPCKICGEPTSGKDPICQKCKLVERLKKLGILK